MSKRTFGRGFLADKIYDAEDAVPAGTFEQIMQRRKKRRPVGWLFLPLVALIGLAGWAGWELQNSGDNSVIISSAPASASMSAHEPNENLLSGKEPFTSSPSSTQGTALTSETKADVTVPYATDKGIYVQPTTTSISKKGGMGMRRQVKASVLSARTRRYQTADVKELPKTPSPISVALNTSSISPDSRLEEASDLKINEDHNQSQNGGITSFSPNVSETSDIITIGSTVGLGLDELVSREMFYRMRVDSEMHSVQPVRVSKRITPHLDLTEILIGVGPLALTQQTTLLANVVSKPGETANRYKSVSVEPGIGLEASISARLPVTSWLGLNAGLRSIVLWQTVSGQILPNTGSPVSYSLAPDQSLIATPAPEQGFTIRSTVWIPFAPQVMAEFRLPNADWGIAAGGTFYAAPQTYFSYQGATPVAEGYKAQPSVQPMAQIWAQASRTRIALTASRVQGTGLLPYPLSSKSDGLFISASMCLRLGR